jgi:hypothetical protein
MFNGTGSWYFSWRCLKNKPHYLSLTVFFEDSSLFMIKASNYSEVKFHTKCSYFYKRLSSALTIFAQLPIQNNALWCHPDILYKALHGGNFTNICLSQSRAAFAQINFDASYGNIIWKKMHQKWCMVQKL